MTTFKNVKLKAVSPQINKSESVDQIERLKIPIYIILLFKKID